MGSLPGNYFMGGQKAGPFQLEALKFHGGHGPLYLASEGNKSYAVKMLLSREGNEDPLSLEKWKALGHRRIARVVAVGDTEHHPYVAAEWLEGGFLNDELEHNPLAPQRMLMLIRAIAEALEVLRSLDLAHGNLKTSNVFVGKPESNASIRVDDVKLLDPALVGWTASDKKSAADDLAACKEILRQMMTDGEGAPPPAMKSLFDAESAAALAAACTACYEQLGEAERTTVRVRAPIAPPPPMTSFPTNWSPPPPRPEFAYTPMAPAVRLTNPAPPPDLMAPDQKVDEPRKRWWMFWR